MSSPDAAAKPTWHASRLTPHDLRRTVASNLLDAGIDVGLVSKLLGHASADVTLRYDRRPGRAKRRAADALVIPYARIVDDPG